MPIAVSSLATRYSLIQLQPKDAVVATTDRYRTSADLPRELPLFPLRGAILLPRVTLPLNIFEPRYLAMFDDVMSGRRLVGIVQPDDKPAEHATASSSESPPGKSVGLKKVGCAGRVTAYQERDDGHVLVTLTGISRFRLVDELSAVTPYRIGVADFDVFGADLSTGLGEDDVDRETLLRVLKSYLEAKDLRTDWNAVTKSSSEFLVNALSVMSPYGPEEKQALLEAGDLKSRADVLVALAEMELASTGSAGGMVQ